MAKDKNIQFVVVTPEKQVVEDTADAIVIPAHDGELGILSERAPLMCELGIGQMRYERDGRTHRVFIDGGFAQVHDNLVTLLTDNAAPAEAITDEMIAGAEQAIADMTGSTPEDIEARRKAKQRAGVLRQLKGGR